jgi:hypothetical protein
MDITVPLPHFASYLKEVKANPRHPYLNELTWLVENFRFDDRTATYAPVGCENFLLHTAIGKG